MLQLSDSLPASRKLLYTILGVVILLALWWALAEMLAVEQVDFKPARLDDPALANLDRDSLNRADSIAFANAKRIGKAYTILPTPLQVVQSFPKLLDSGGDNLLGNALHSIWLNLKGYFWAIVLSVPIAFLIGLLPFFGGMFSRPVDAMRYLPLSALTGLFMLWFGSGDTMKVAFLAFGIMVYMIPVIVQRIREVESVHLQTVHTLGATDWQSIRKVVFPSVFSKFMDDLRVLTAISWTYIIIAEILNRGKGLGSLIYGKARLSQTDAVFAILIAIIIIGILQDKLFVWLDKRLFPHKYYKTKVGGLKEIQLGIALLFGLMLVLIFLPMIGVDISALSTVAMIFALACVGLILMGEFKLWQTAKK